MISPGRAWNYPYSCSEWTSLGANYPIVDDDSTGIWSLFGNGTVPQNVILDHTLTVRYTLSGFNPDQTVQVIEQLLQDIPETSIHTYQELPRGFTVSPLYPNPFNHNTRIPFAVFRDTRIVITVFDLLGHPLEILADERFPAGDYTINWSPGQISTGLYFVQFQTEESSQSRKVFLLK